MGHHRVPMVQVPMAQVLMAVAEASVLLHIQLHPIQIIMIHIHHRRSGRMGSLHITTTIEIASKHMQMHYTFRLPG